tara:strand:- start:2536 stop:2751 length:216 start_codon:yes stop_codon:yes gene_type:complete
MNWNWSNWIMDFLLILQAFGTSPTPGSDASEFDFNNNGQIDMQDVLTFLSYQPPPSDEVGETTNYSYHQKR